MARWRQRSVRCPELLLIVLLLVCSCIPVKGYPDLKEDLRLQLELFKIKLKDVEELKRDKNVNNYINALYDKTVRHIKRVFSQLHEHLRSEEARRLSELRFENIQKHYMISSLPEKIRDLEEKMAAQDAAFLQDYMSTVMIKDDAEQFSRVIDVAKHLGNLKFNVWRKMGSKVKYIPVTLDPNSAHPKFLLSDDLTSLTSGDGSQYLPDTPFRFNPVPSLLGYEPCCSHSRSWEVDLRGSDSWVVGIMSESLSKKGQEWASLRGRWYVYCDRGQCGMHFPPSSPIPFKVEKKIERIRVEVDCPGRVVTFSYPDENTYKHALPITDHVRVYPYFSSSTLKVLPVDISVSVK